MIEKFLSLFERLVAALEKNADASHNLIAHLNGQTILSVVDVSNGMECTAEKPKAEKPKKEPKAEKPKAEPKKEPEVSFEDMKKAVSEYAARRAHDVKDGRIQGDPKELARDLMAQFGGGVRATGEIKPEFFAAVVKACTENWMPEVQEEDNM